MIIYVVNIAEKGEFLALDLGGSKFRVLKVKVSEDGKQNVQMESQFYPTPKEIIQGNGTDVSRTFHLANVLIVLEFDEARF